MTLSTEGRWTFSYDEDDFIIANRPGANEAVQEALSNHLDDARRLTSVEWLLSEWQVVKASYPEDPIGVAFNATKATLSGVGVVTISSQYEQFDSVTISEENFLSAVLDFRDFLSSAEGSQRES
ncbi:hypothetical protein OH786_14955 [Streptomyces atratus]|uniref:hypothetical protein n=1 Tax=Streptomyces atratus TaxID=1893 RepID=UPI001160F8B9|nr:hypothetical protein [Streptomyces atratus]